MNVRLSIFIYSRRVLLSPSTRLVLLQVDHGHEGLLAYAIHPGGVATDMGLRMPSFTHALLTETPELAGDTIAFLTRERRGWLAGRYISCEYSRALSMSGDSHHIYFFTSYLGYGRATCEKTGDCERRQAEGPHGGVTAPTLQYQVHGYIHLLCAIIPQPSFTHTFLPSDTI